MWKNILEPSRPQMTIWRQRIALYTQNISYLLPVKCKDDYETAPQWYIYAYIAGLALRHPHLESSHAVLTFLGITFHKNTPTVLLFSSKTVLIAHNFENTIHQCFRTRVPQNKVRDFGKKVNALLTYLLHGAEPFLRS
jgi:hypothetical protein